jgi:uncharacterized protein (TIRG00374 family)
LIERLATARRGATLGRGATEGVSRVRLSRKWLHIFLQLAISGAFLAGLVLMVGADSLARALRGADFWWLIPAVVVNLASNYMRAIRWHFLLRPIGLVKVRQLYGVILVSLATNTILPLRAGDVFRFQYMGSRGFDRAAVVGTLATERLLDAVIFMVFLGLGALFLHLSTALSAFAMAYVVGIAAGFAIGIAFAGLGNHDASERFIVLRVVPRRFRGKAAELFVAFARGLAPLRRPKLLTVCLLTSASAWLLEAMIYFFAGQALHLSVDFLGYLVVVGIANTIVAIPLTQASVGPYEFFTTQVVSLLGATRSVAAAYAIVVHAMVAIPITAAGLLAVWIMRLDFGDVFYLRRRSPEAPALPVLSSGQ